MAVGTAQALQRQLGGSLCSSMALRTALPTMAWASRKHALVHQIVGEIGRGGMAPRR